MLSKQERDLIVRLGESGSSPSTIAALLGRGRATVYRILISPHRVHTQRDAAVKTRQRVVKKLVEARSRKGDRIFPKYRGAAAIAAALTRQTGDTVSKATICRDLRKLGYRSYVRRPATTRERREVTAKTAWFAKHKKILRVRSLTVADETFISANERTGRSMWARDRRHVLPVEKKRRHNTANLHIYLACGWGWKAPLVFLPKLRSEGCEDVKFTLNADRYIRVCLSKVIPIMPRGHSFLHDNARCHSAKKVAGYFARKGISVVTIPPYCPEANPAEGVIGELKDRIGALCPLTATELKQAAIAAWDAFPQKAINQHFVGLEHRLAQA